MSVPTVLVLLRADPDRRPGGDLLHAREAGEYAAASGFRLRVAAGVPDDLSGVDLVHLWNLTRPQDAWVQARAARERGIPYVLTPVHHALLRYQREGRRGLAGWIARLARTEAGAERARRAWLRLRDNEQAPILRGAPPWETQRRDLVAGAAHVLWTCERERDEVLAAVGLASKGVPGSIVPTAIPPDPPADPGPGRALLPFEGPFVLSVGRIEDLKNPLAAIAAVDRLRLPLVVVGPANPRHPRYVSAFRAALARSPRVTWLGPRPREVVLSLMAAARVHVLPSWAESVGRVTLEAALQGCAVVSTTAGYAADLLGDAVFLCDPGDVGSVATAIARAWEEGGGAAGERVRAALTWDTVGARVARAWRVGIGGG